MIKKALILGLLMCSILLASTLLVSAADQETTLNDTEDDVLDWLQSTEEELVYTAEKPNIDIVQLDYSRTGKRVTLALTVKGKIEDRGSMEEEEENYDLVSYMIVLYTSETYEIVYVNEKCELNESTEGISFDVDDSTITFRFNLNSADEPYTGIEVLTMDSYYDIANYWMYADDLTDISQEIEVDAGESYEGKVGQGINFTGTAYGGNPPYTYKWDFDGDFIIDLTTTEQDVSHVFNKAGTYDVYLFVTDSDDITGFGYTTAIISSGTADGGNGDQDADSSDSGSGLLTFVALVVVIIVAGVAVVVYIIRR